MTNPFTVEACGSTGVARLVLSGEFDHAGISELQAACGRSGAVRTS